MNDGVTADANVMNLFSQKLSGKPIKLSGNLIEDAERQELVDQADLLVNRIQDGIGFVIDAGEKIQTQWLQTCGQKEDAPFREWFVRALHSKKIKMVAPKLTQHEKKCLFNKFGFPKDQFEWVYIAVANATKRKYIVSQDIHFYDPKLRDASAGAKHDAKVNRNGALRRHLSSKFGVTVGLIRHALEELPNTPAADNAPPVT